MFSFGSFSFDLGQSATPETLESRTLEGVADYIKSGKARRITVLTGAGLSTAAGIPDFRSPGTGLYANLARLKLPYAEAVFDIAYFRRHPEPFYYLAKELYPGKFHPTISHVFIALLAKKGLLQMNFTQNIDCLERRAGVPADKIVEAHGSFATQRCIECSAPFPDDRMLLHVEAEIVPRCNKCKKGLVKPDIVFFGEALPDSFRNNAHLAAQSDLVIIIGTSLTVYPFAGLPESVPSGVPRLLLNKERVGQIGRRSDDVAELGSCDAGVRKLAALLGWEKELDALWRSVVGEKEAERQISSAEGPEDDLEEEVRKMTEGIDSALKLEDDEDTTAEGESFVQRMARILGRRSSTGTKPAPKQQASRDADADPGKKSAPASPSSSKGRGKGDSTAHADESKDVVSEKARKTNIAVPASRARSHDLPVATAVDQAEGDWRSSESRSDESIHKDVQEPTPTPKELKSGSLHLGDTDRLEASKSHETSEEISEIPSEP